MNRYGSTRDMTMSRAVGGGGMDVRSLWLCGHKHASGEKRRVAGRQPLLWKCAACVEKGKEAAPNA